MRGHFTAAQAWGRPKSQENQHVPQFEQLHCGLPGRASDGMDVADCRESLDLAEFVVRKGAQVRAFLVFGLVMMITRNVVRLGKMHLRRG